MPELQDAPAVSFTDRRLGGPHSTPAIERRQFANSYEELSPDARELANAIESDSMRRGDVFRAARLLLREIEGLPRRDYWGGSEIEWGRRFLPTNGSQIATVEIDRTGTTRIGRFVINHSFLVPVLIYAVVAVGVGLIIAQFLK